MATFYQRKWKNGRKSTWYIKYYDESGIRQTVKGFTDKKATEQFAHKLEQEAFLRKQGIIDPLADKIAQEGRKPIADHMQDFYSNVLSCGVTADYAKKLCFRATKVTSLIQAEYLIDLTSSAVQKALSKIKKEGLSLKTVNDHLAAVKQFMKWAESDKRILKNPISHLKRFNVAVDRRHDRRALSDDELIRLIRVTSEQGKTFEYCTGKERALIYKVSALTGLRRNEISSLTKGSFDLDSSTPTVRVEAAFSKHRREDILPLTEDLIPDLRIHLSGKEANESIPCTQTAEHHYPGRFEKCRHSL